MKVMYKNKQDFKKRMLKKGFNPNSLSLSIGKCRQFIGQSLKRGIIGADSARKISEILKEEYEELFEFR